MSGGQLKRDSDSLDTDTPQTPRIWSEDCLQAPGEGEGQAKDRQHQGHEAQTRAVITSPAFGLVSGFDTAKPTTSRGRGNGGYSSVNGPVGPRPGLSFPNEYTKQ